MSTLAYDLEPRTLTPRCQHSGSLDFNTGTSQRPPSRESMNEQSTGKPPPPTRRPSHTAVLHSRGGGPRRRARRSRLSVIF
jgi:hypothetical protein